MILLLFLHHSIYMLSLKSEKMVSLKKLAYMAKKWQIMAALGTRRITMSNKYHNINSDQRSTTQMAENGHFVIYSIDGRRFMISLVYLSSKIVEQLFRLSEDEFGFTVDGPIKLAFDGDFMEYVMDLLKKGVSEEVERALISSLLLPCSYDSFSMQKMEVQRQIEVCSS